MGRKFDDSKDLVLVPSACSLRTGSGLTTLPPPSSNHQRKPNIYPFHQDFILYPSQKDSIVDIRHEKRPQPSDVAVDARNQSKPQQHASNEREEPVKMTASMREFQCNLPAPTARVSAPNAKRESLPPRDLTREPPQLAPPARLPTPDLSDLEDDMFEEL